MKFIGSKYYLSNSYQCPMDLEIGGVTYHFMCAEAAFQACRCPDIASEFTGMTAREAKDRGKHARKREVRPDWDDVKMAEYDRVLMAKFENISLRTQLLSEESPIVMENDYMDRYWGVVDGRGQNRMGKALDRVKERIQEQLGIHINKEPSVVTYKVQEGGIVAFDTETTGTSPKYDDILQITIVGQDGSILLDTYVKPQNCKSWKDAEAVNHISKEMVENAPDAEKVAEVVKKIFDHADAVVGHNVSFDIRMVEARFGYDFQAKEERVKQAHPELVKSNLLFAKTKIAYVVSYCKQLEEAGVLKKDYPEALLKHPYYIRLKKDKVKPEEMTEADIDEFASKYAESVFVYDTLKDFRQYDADMEITRQSHKLVDAMWEFYPNEAARFEMEAHDACVDTVATLKVAIKLNEHLGRELPLGTSVWEDKMFGIEDGIVCHQVNCDGVIPTNGFTKRLFDQFPQLRRQFKEAAAMCRQKGIDPFGKVRIDRVDEFLYTATIYSQSHAGNAEVSGVVYTDKDALIGAIRNVCDKYPDKCIYLPVVHTDGVITDGIGCGRGGLKWSELEPALSSLQKKNLFTVDTQTGEIGSFQKKAELNLEEEDCQDIELS